MPHSPRWTRSLGGEPSRILFPLGAFLGVVSVVPFPLRGAAGGALGLFHPVAQSLGFLTCFALGFLFSVVPRLTGTRGPDGWDLLAGVVFPPVMVLSAWGNASPLPYLLWFAIVAVALHFTAARIRRLPPGVTAPAALVWVPLSVAAGVAGAALVAAAPLLPAGGFRAWTIGRGLLAHGLSAGLVLGLAGTVARRWTADAPSAPRREGARGALAGHAAAALLFFGSYPLEVLVNVRLGLALRAAVATAVLAAARVPAMRAAPALERRLAWIGAALVPLGFWLAALCPRQRAAALHVTFVGGFALLALAASAHVALGGAASANRRPRIPVALSAMALLLVAAFTARLAAAWDARRVAAWLSAAALCFIAAVVAWAIALSPALLASPGPEGPRFGPGRS